LLWQLKKIWLINRKETKVFDDYCKVIANHTPEQEAEDIKAIALEINQEVAQKQKSVIMIELMSIVMADGTISAHEEMVSKAIGKSLNVSDNDQALIKDYVLGQQQGEFENDAVLSIDSSSSYSGKGRHLYRDDLDGVIVILYLASTDSFFFKYVGHTDVYLNSVPQKPGNINALAIGSLIRWGHADPVYYGDILSVFKKIDSSTRTSFEAINISYKFKNGRLGLREVNVNEESGNLIALMGASGAGKSTLLHVLNGNHRMEKC